MNKVIVTDELAEKAEIMSEKCQVVIDACKSLRETIDKELYQIEQTATSIKNNL